MIYFSPHLLIAISFLGAHRMGSYVWTATVLLFVIIPLIEILSRHYKFNPTEHRSKWGDVSLALTPISLTAFLIFSLLQSRTASTTHELVGLAVSAGVIIGAIGITAAHELVHRRQKYFRALGVWNLALCNFAHWGLEHVFGHHKNVATPIDPATARKNEWLYTFWFRTYFGVLAGAWSISKKKVTLYWIGSAVISAIIYFTLGTTPLLMWWISSVFACLLLHTVDYVEHYGLVRAKKEDGTYMPFKAQHAWDSASIATNINLYNLGLHSHHHMKAAVHFQDLSEQADAHEMPFGYSVMFLLALFPFVYIPFMNKKLLS